MSTTERHQSLMLREPLLCFLGKTAHAGVVDIPGKLERFLCRLARNLVLLPLYIARVFRRDFDLLRFGGAGNGQVDPASLDFCLAWANGVCRLAYLCVDTASQDVAFHERYGTSIGEYVRNARLDWAASRLVCGDEPLAALALEAGFADQSHLTRQFKRAYGLTPARWRALTSPSAYAGTASG